MKKKLRSNLIVLLAAILVFMLPVPALAAETGGTCGDDLQWQLADGVLTVTGSGAMRDFPESEMAPWYPLREQITEVRLPEGLTTVGSLAFYGCTALTAVTLPQSVTAIGSYAFAECSSLQTFRMNESVTSIGECAFRACEKLAAITLPGSFEKLGSMAFYRCESLTAVTVPASVGSMGVSVFAYCKSLVRATLSARLAGVPTWTFYGCSALTEVTLSSTMQSAGEYAFRGCDSIETISTASGDPTVAEELLESIRRGDTSFSADGAVTAEPPKGNTTTATEKNGGQTTVSEKENSTITVKREHDGEKETTRIDATLDNSNGWSDLKDTIDEVRSGGVTGTLDITVRPDSGVVSGKDLSKVGGEDAVITICPDDGSQWKIDTTKTPDKDYSGKYTLGATVTKTDPDKTDIESDKVYKVDFAGNTDFDMTVGIKVDQENARQYATIYQKNEPLQTVVVDDEGYAWFQMGKISKKTAYYVGVNAADADTANATIPATLTDAYGIDYTLTDSTGKGYQVTGRSSRWGITGGRFATYVGIAVALVVLIVALVMITLNKLAKNKAKYATPQGEDDTIDEDALRLQVMQEMLEETRQSNNKKE